jgi:hypothetical protein
MRLFLEFVRSQGAVKQHRLTYAFCLFCAVYDHLPILDPRQAQTSAQCFNRDQTGQPPGN